MAGRILPKPVWLAAMLCKNNWYKRPALVSVRKSYPQMWKIRKMESGDCAIERNKRCV